MPEGGQDGRKIIVVGDGETDYLFLKKAMERDPELRDLPVCLIKPEDVGLTRRTGGGHKTLLQDIGLAAFKAAQGYAQGVFALVDNDGDPRFAFPHEPRCEDCRECEAWRAMEMINWGEPFQKGAAILYQAVETLLLSARPGFTPQLESSLYGSSLKTRLYQRQITDLFELFTAFEQALAQTDMTRIQAKSYPRLKKILIKMIKTKNADGTHTQKAVHQGPGSGPAPR